MSYKSLLFIIATFLILFLLPTETMAQCAMCKAAVETSLKEGSLKAVNLNKGILYLVSFPYMIVLIIGIFWYRANRKRELVK